MHIHILGICGTFMGGIAAIASRAGFKVTGCDANVYPPMSTQLEALGIALTEGYAAAQLEGVARGADVFVVGNALSRGNPLVEEILDRRLPYQSGPQWLFEHVLKDKWVLAVAGTHGKTTVTSMLAWILDHAGRDPGFLIGGVPSNFGISARLTDSEFFVIEADEYDTAFFDKRSKFVHYRPRTAILNNLEFDHADIFPDLGAIETQFHHLVRSVPRSGSLIVNAEEASLARVLARGCWSPIDSFGGEDFTAVERRGRRIARAAMAHRRRRRGVVRWKSAGRRALAGGTSAARPPQSPERARRDRGRASCRACRRRRESRRSPSFAVSSGDWRRAASRPASPSTTTSRTIRPRSRPPWTACGAQWAPGAFSPCSSLARTR
jgi:UDP-N-acetylmuramate: L-alanyl-gamma-D-glutamyl-meso-diaminopimelate ligase